MRACSPARPAVLAFLGIALAGFFLASSAVAVPNPDELHTLTRSTGDGSHLHIIIPDIFASPFSTDMAESSMEPSVEPDGDTPETSVEPAWTIEPNNSAEPDHPLYPRATEGESPFVVDITSTDSQESASNTENTTPATEKVVYSIPLQVDISGSTVPRSLDHSIRNISAAQSGTSIKDWSLISQEALATHKTLAASRQVILSKIVPNEKQRWKLIYHGRMSNAQLPIYEQFIDQGGMDIALSQQPDIGKVQVRMSGIPTRVLSTKSPKVAQPSTEKTSDTSNAPATIPNRSRKRSYIWQISLGVCLVASVLLVGAVALLRHHRKSGSRGQNELEGDDAFMRTRSLGTISEFSSAAECRLTSVGPGPRGPEVLRQQAGIMDWQQNAAAAAELEGVVPAMNGNLSNGLTTPRDSIIESSYYTESCTSSDDPDVLSDTDQPNSSAQHSFVSFGQPFGAPDSHGS